MLPSKTLSQKVSAINILDELLSYPTIITREDLIGFPSGQEVKLSTTGLPNPKKPRQNQEELQFLTAYWN